MNFEQIAAWRAVRQDGTTLAAARRLGLSQSAVSRRITQLEASLGVALFTRDKAALIPTRESAMLEHHLASLADRGTSLRRLAAEVKAGNSDALPLRIAVPGSLTFSILPEIIARFMALHEKARIELHTGPYDAIERMLQDDRAEIGFLRLPSRSAALSLHPVLTVRTVCVLPATHRLADRDVVALSDLRGEPLILLGRQRAPRGEIDSALLSAGIATDVRIEAHSVGSACGLVAAGMGITLVNELMARDFVHMGIAIRPIDAALTHHFAFATLADLPPTKAAREFIRVGTEVLRRSTGDTTASEIAPGRSRQPLGPNRSVNRPNP